MSWFRRKIISKQQQDYIKDGLVFQLDGINKGATDGTWVDLIGGVIYTPMGTTIAVENGFELKKLGDYIAGTFLYEYPDVDWTIEVCVEVTKQGGSGCMVFTPNTARTFKNPAFLVRKGKIWGQPYGVTSVIYQDGGTLSYKTYSMNKERIVFDMQSKTMPTTKSNHDAYSSRYGIGSSANYYGFTGVIHAVRVYSRMLSEAEIMHNQKLDNKRFKLGL